MSDSSLHQRLMVATTLLVLPVVGYLAWGGESYCILYPGIDTRYAAGFSEKAFATIEVGMTKEEVIRRLGEPFGGAPARAGSRWSYTSDGACPWADWAWLGREIVFKDDRVVERISRVYYD